MDDEKIDAMIDEFGWVFDTPVKKLDLRCQFKAVAKAARRELIEWLKDNMASVHAYAKGSPFNVPVMRLDKNKWQALLKELE